MIVLESDCNTEGGRDKCEPCPAVTLDSKYSIHGKGNVHPAPGVSNTRNLSLRPVLQYQTYHTPVVTAIIERFRTIRIVNESMLLGKGVQKNKNARICA